MSNSAYPNSDASTPPAWGAVDSPNGLPTGGAPTRRQLRRARLALEDFDMVVGGQSHCLVIAGPFGFLEHDDRKPTEVEVLNSLHRHFGYPEVPGDVTLHVILDSAGGSLDAAFKIAIFLRSFARNTHIYVPVRAKSAATLLALGADKIMMSPFAELGPLDSQIKDPRSPTKWVSALDCYQSVDYVQKFGLDTLPKALRVLLRETDGRSPLSDLVGPSADFALSEVVPMLGQVRALDFGSWGRTLKIGERYARALQLRLGHPDFEDAAARIAETLVYGYPHHPFFLDCVEAQEIGLNAVLMREQEYATTLGIAEACAGTRCIGFKEDLEEREESLPALETRPRRSGRPSNGDRAPTSMPSEETAAFYDAGVRTRKNVTPEGNYDVGSKGNNGSSQEGNDDAGSPGTSPDSG